MRALLLASLALAACSPDIALGRVPVRRRAGRAPTARRATASTTTCVLAVGRAAVRVRRDGDRVEPDDDRPRRRALPGARVRVAAGRARRLHRRRRRRGLVPRSGAGEVHGGAGRGAARRSRSRSRPLARRARGTSTAMTQVASASGTPCANDDRRPASRALCIDADVTPGGTTASRVEPTGGGDCDGACAYNRYIADRAARSVRRARDVVSARVELAGGAVPRVRGDAARGVVLRRRSIRGDRVMRLGVIGAAHDRAAVGAVLRRSSRCTTDPVIATRLLRLGQGTGRADRPEPPARAARRRAASSSATAGSRGSRAWSARCSLAIAGRRPGSCPACSELPSGMFYIRARAADRRCTSRSSSCGSSSASSIVRRSTPRGERRRIARLVIGRARVRRDRLARHAARVRRVGRVPDRVAAGDRAGA